MPKKILIVDDDVDFVEAITNTLQAKGFAVVTASGGEEGFRKAREGADLILLDVMMKKRTEGFEVARRIRQEAATKHIPVILITGMRRELNLPFGFEADEKWLPVQAVLEKPVKPETLLKTIEKVL